MPILATLRANLLATALGLLAAILLVVSVVQTVRLSGFLWIDGALDKIETLTRDNNELRAELKAISDAKDKQRAETSKRIGQSEKQRQISDKVARGIEEAPVAPDCRTPDVILKADI
jgi:hypothetical protein